ncbi:MAG: type II toxin-antitoxin system RelE/ParE family toxin [Nitrospirales bacterium]
MLLQIIMTGSFSDRNTEKFFGGERVREFAGFKKAAERKFEILDNAEELVDLLVSPGNKFEKLSGNRNGQHSIRINDQWRVCFVWRKDGPYDVEITDYH